MSFENATPRPWTKSGYGRLKSPNGGTVSVYDLGISMVMTKPTEEERVNAELIVTAVNAHDEMQVALKRAADMLHAVAGDLEDGYSLDTLREKYVMAVLGARDAAYAALKQSRAKA